MITTLKIFEFALKSLFPTVQGLEGGVTQEGFYCEALLPYFADEQTLPLIEEKVKGIVKGDFPIKTFEMMRENGVAFLLHHKQPEAAAQVQEWAGNTIRLAEFEKFSFPLFDATIGKSTKEGGTIKILRVERVGEKTQFWVAVKENPQELKQWLKIWKAQESHEVLGENLALWTAINGTLVWKPKGVALRHEIQKIFNENLENSPFLPIFSSPYAIQDRVDLFLASTEPKLSHLREWIEGETGKTSRLGLFDATPFTRGVLHAFVPNGQVEQALISSLQFFDKIFKIFGFEVKWSLASERAAQTKTSRTDWDRAVKWLAGALEARGCTITKTARNSQTWISALEGPTLEGYVVDKLDRKWLVASLGVDLTRADLTFSSETALQKHAASPLTLLKGAIGESLERIIALLLEARQGNLPWEWAPEQVRVVVVGQQCAAHAANVHQALTQAGFRAKVDCSDSRLGAKVHAAEREQVPFLVVIGDRELRNGQITVRSYETREEFSPEGTSYRLDDFIRFLEDRFRRLPT